MTSLLFIVSFLFHIVSIYMIIQLYWQVQSLKNSESNEISELLESYLQEIKEENNRLHKAVHEKTPNQKQAREVLTASEDASADAGEKHIEEREDAVIYKDSIQDVVEASLESKVLQLHTQGYSIIDIAKKLDCGKTEAELIINFNKKKRN